MEIMDEGNLLEYTVVKDKRGHYMITINASGIIVESDLGEDETSAQGKTITLVEGLRDAVRTILDGLISAYGDAEDRQEEAQQLVDDFAEDVNSKE